MAIDETRLQNLLDREEIRDVTLRYTRGIDRHDSEILNAAYHSDGRDDHGIFIGSASDFTEWANNLHGAHYIGHQHHMTNQIIDIDGDTAHAETYCIVFLVRADETVDVAGSRYVDRLERRSGMWAITDRVCVLECSGQLAKGGQVPPRDLFIQGCWDREDIAYKRPLNVDRPDRDGRGNDL